MEYLVSKAEQAQIREAIEAFEVKSSAEIVTVIAKQSDNYPYIPTLWAAVMTLVISWPLFGMLGLEDKNTFTLAQIALFGALVFIVHLKPIKFRILPASVKKKRSANKARETFFELLQQEESNEGFVVLYVSEAEKYVEIIADPLVHEKIYNMYWEEIVANFISHVHNGEIAKGYLEAIERTSELLIEHFPACEGDKNSLPDHLILV